MQDSYGAVWNPAQGVVVTTAVLTGARVAPVTAQFWDADITVNDTITDPLSLVFAEDQIRSGVVTFGASGGLDSMTFVITAH